MYFIISKVLNFRIPHCFTHQYRRCSMLTLFNSMLIGYFTLTSFNYLFKIILRSLMFETIRIILIHDTCVTFRLINSNHIIIIIIIIKEKIIKTSKLYRSLNYHGAAFKVHI
jgi:hypothetical protein